MKSSLVWILLPKKPTISLSFDSADELSLGA